MPHPHYIKLSGWLDELEIKSSSVSQFCLVLVLHHRMTYIGHTPLYFRVYLMTINLPLLDQIPSNIIFFTAKSTFPHMLHVCWFWYCEFYTISTLHHTASSIVKYIQARQKKNSDLPKSSYFWSGVPWKPPINPMESQWHTKYNRLWSRFRTKQLVVERRSSIAFALVKMPVLLT